MKESKKKTAIFMPETALLGISLSPRCFNGVCNDWTDPLWQIQHLWMGAPLRRSFYKGWGKWIQLLKSTKNSYIKRKLFLRLINYFFMVRELN